MSRAMDIGQLHKAADDQAQNGHRPLDARADIVKAASSGFHGERVGPALEMVWLRMEPPTMGRSAFEPTK